MKTARTPIVRPKSSRPARTGCSSGGLSVSLAPSSPRPAESAGQVPPRSGKPRPGPIKGQRPPSSGPTSGRPPVLRVEQRRNIRFDKAFPVAIRSEAFGESSAIARNVSAGGIMVELSEPLPLGTAVQVFFSVPDSHARIVARGEVKNHYFLNFADPKGGLHALTGMGVRFTGFESDSDLLLGLGLTRLRTVLH